MIRRIGGWPRGSRARGLLRGLMKTFLLDLDGWLDNWASATAASGEPAKCESGFAGSWRCHEVSILIARIGPLGRCRDVEPRAKHLHSGDHQRDAEARL